MVGLRWQKCQPVSLKLRPKQEEAILALLTTQGVDNGARAVGIAPRTLYRIDERAAVRPGLPEGAEGSLWAKARRGCSRLRVRRSPPC